MKVRAVAMASERSNAIGTVELECTPRGLLLVHRGVGAFSEDYAPGALTSGTRVTVPWPSVAKAELEGERLFLSFDPGLSPHHRLLLANFSIGRSDEPETIKKKRWLVRAATFAFALVTALVSGSIAARFTGGGGVPASIGVAVGGAVAVLLIGLLADRLLAYGGVPPDAVREDFVRELAAYLPVLDAGPPAPKARRPITLADLQGLLPRTTFAVVVTLTASSLAAVLVTQWTVSSEERRARASAPPWPEAEPRPPAPAAVASRAPATSIAPRTLAPRKPAETKAPAGQVTLGQPCRCLRADSLLWSDPIPRLSVLILKSHVRPGRGAPHKESLRKRYTDLDVAVVNNSDASIDEVSLLVLFYEEKRGGGRGEQVSNRPLFFEGPLLPGQAIKWSTEAEGSFFEIQAPALGSLGPDGETAAPADRLAELVSAIHRPVRLHGTMMLSFLGDARAREAALGLKDALREDEAPYLTRIMHAQADVRVCRLQVNDERERRRVSGCLYNNASEPRRELGIKLRGLDGPVLASDPVGPPPNLVVERVLGIPGELAGENGVTFSATLDKSGAPIAWETVVDREDLLR